VQEHVILKQTEMWFYRLTGSMACGRSFQQNALITGHWFNCKELSKYYSSFSFF